MFQTRKILALVVIVAALLVSTVSIGAAQGPARNANWVVSVTYQNVGNASSEVLVKFYPEGSSTAIDYNPLAGVGDGKLAAGAGASFFIGRVNGLQSGFRGNAVMSASQPLVATVVQFSQDAGFRMRLLSNGFQSTDASSQYLIATALLNVFSRTTVFSIQNTQSESINATVRFYDANAGGALVSTKVHSIPALSSKYIEMDDMNDTGFDASRTVFNGSAIVTAEKVGGGAAQVVASVNEYYLNQPVAAAFEGLPLSAAANTLNMATAICERFGLDTFYAVQNASLNQNAKITITYKDANGANKAVDGPYDIGPGQKRSIRTCNPSDGTNMSNFTGAAIITSEGAPIAAIGKAQNSINAGSPDTELVFTAFLGEASGTDELSLPFVRWGNDERYGAAANTGGVQRSFVAIQNLGASSIKVIAEYRDKTGALVGSETLEIAANAKANTNASKAGALGKNSMNAGEFGYYTDGTFGGALVVKAHPDNPSARFIAIARVQHPGAGEDYNAFQTGN